MTLSVAGNNSINRWKEGVGVPQSKEGHSFGQRAQTLTPDVTAYFKTFLTPTPEKYRTMVSKVATLPDSAGTGAPLSISKRPPLESRAEVEKALQECRARKSRLPLVNEAKAREVVPELPPGPVPQWILLLANFPRDGKSRITSIRASDERKSDLTPLMKAQISWIVARQDRAWYAVGLAKQRLRELGQSDDDIYKLDGDWSGFTPAERSLFTVARHLAATPIVLTDEDAAVALKLTGPREFVQTVIHVTNRALFNRVTEAAGLQLDGK